MRQFLFLCITSLIGAPLLYFALVTVVLGRKPAIKEFLWPTENSSLNASLAHWNGTPPDNMVIGSSIALKNISAGVLNTKTESWKTIGGFGLDPRQSLALIQELKITHSKVILPLSILEITKINRGQQRPLTFRKHELTSIRSFLRLEKLRKLDDTNYSHINFDAHGNCTIAPSDNGQNVPQSLIGKQFTGDTTGIIRFAQQCDSIAKVLDSHIHLVTTPFCHDLGKLNHTNQNLICNIQYNSSNCTLHHNLCDSTESSHFTDAYHFNATGAQIFTARLKKDL